MQVFIRIGFNKNYRNQNFTTSMINLSFYLDSILFT